MTGIGGTQTRSGDRSRLMDVLRGLLASWVVLHHIVLTGRFNPDVYPWRLLAHHGQEAVLVFFILSGFAITRSLVNAPQRWSSFLLARFWRIYPVYVIALGIGAIVCRITLMQDTVFAEFGRLGIEPWEVTEGSPQWLHLLLHLSQLHGVIPETWLPHADTSLVAPAWSLSTEFQFYVIAPAMCCLGLPRSAPLSLRLPVMLVLAVLVANFLVVPAIAPAGIPRYLDLFALGVAGAMLHSSGGRGRLAYSLLAVFVAIIGWHAGRIIVANAVAVWLVFWLASTLLPERLLNNRVGAAAMFVGALSYPLYLVHYPLMRLTLLAACAAFPQSRSVLLAAWIPAAILLSYAVAALLHRFIEVHGTRYGKRVAARRDLRQPRLPAQQPTGRLVLRRLRTDSR